MTFFALALILLVGAAASTGRADWVLDPGPRVYVRPVESIPVNIYAKGSRLGGSQFSISVNNAIAAPAISPVIEFTGGMTYWPTIPAPRIFETREVDYSSLVEFSLSQRASGNLGRPAISPVNDPRNPIVTIAIKVVAALSALMGVVFATGIGRYAVKKQKNVCGWWAAYRVRRQDRRRGTEGLVGADIERKI